jgi:hypothetical protein
MPLLLDWTPNRLVVGMHFVVQSRFVVVHPS